MSTSFTTRASGWIIKHKRQTTACGAIGKSPKKKALHSGKALIFWRRDPESNRADRICNPGHNRFAIAPLFAG